MPDLPSGTVTFLFTDIEGSTRLLQELGDRYAEALAEHRRALREAFERHGGAEVDTQGDAFFFAFERASDALAAARAGQDALAQGPIRVRMGVHTGEPIVTEEGYVGVDVHRGARIAAAGHGGQVLLSAVTADLVGGQVQVRDLGEHRLKDLTGPERIYQLGDGEFRPLKTLFGTNLPVQPSPLVGRERELREAGALLREHRVVTLVGPGGSGKTRLALQLAADAVEEFEHGVLWVPLQALRDPELVLTTIAGTIGASDGLAEHIRDRRMLLLLDNLEQLLDAAPALAELVAATPHLKLLITSREQLRIDAEHEYVVDPLPERDAVELFTSRAVDAEPRPVVAEICRRLDFLPLAVELAAARTKLLPPEQLLARLERRLPVLTTGRRDAPERQRTLRATIEWSHDLLSDTEKLLFARLAVFRGSFTIEAAEAVCKADLDMLESLVDKSLVRRWGSGRHGMLETIHEYASERLDELADADEVRRRHAEYFLALATSAGLYQEAETAQRHELVQPEHDNVRAALEWCLASGEIELGLRIANSLENFWVVTNPHEGQRWFELLLAVAGEVSPEVRAHALRAYGGSVNITANIDRAERLYEESLAEWRALGDTRRVGILLHRLGNCHLQRRDLARARPLFDEALEIFRAFPFARGEAQVLGSLGDVERLQGNLERAFELNAKSAALAEQVGFIWWHAGVLTELADLAEELGRPEEALEYALEALRLEARMRDRIGAVFSLALLARLAAGRGEAERAGLFWGAIEAEEQRGPLGFWERHRDDFAVRVLAKGSPDFERGRFDGQRLALDEAVEYALERVNA